MPSDKFLSGFATATAVLNRDRPGWYRRIDLDTLNMEDADHCIIGQTYGTDVINYCEMLRDLGLYDTDAETALSSHTDYWKRYIQNRRDSERTPAIPTQANPFDIVQNIKHKVDNLTIRQSVENIDRLNDALEILSQIS